MRLFEAVSKILWEEWDPLQLRDAADVPDEYDDYVPEMVALLERGASVDELADSLDRIYVSKMGSRTSSPPRAKSAHAAEALKRLGVSN
jgi:hypothetical protein